MFVLVVTDACRGTIGRGGLVAVVLYLCRALIAVLLRRYICGIFSCPIKATATIALRFQDTREKGGGGREGKVVKRMCVPMSVSTQKSVIVSWYFEPSQP